MPTSAGGWAFRWGQVCGWSGEAVQGGGVPTYVGAGREDYDKAVTDKQRRRVRINDMLKQLKAIPEYKKLDEKGLLATPEAQALMKKFKGAPASQQRMPSDFDDDA